jgi:hypothetical protein
VPGNPTSPPQSLVKPEQCAPERTKTPSGLSIKNDVQWVNQERDQGSGQKGNDV